jgi:hypothetical protein
LLIFVPIGLSAGRYYWLDDRRGNWQSADRSSAGLLPAPSGHPEALIRVYAARTVRWRSIFAVHTWIVVKPANAPSYTRYDVMGFGQPVRVNLHAPDAFWFSGAPRLVADIRGDDAERAIPAIQAAVKSYPYADYGSYRVWPGPNSNTFTATVLRAAPELAVAMPPEAVGRDFRADGSFFGATASRTGFEVTVYGLIGAKLGWVEGVEVDFLGLVAGLDLRHPALKIPGFGRLGLDGVATASAR